MEPDTEGEMRLEVTSKEEVKNEENKNDFEEGHSVINMNEIPKVDKGKVMRSVSLSARKKYLNKYLQKLLDIRSKYKDVEFIGEFGIPRIFTCGACAQRFNYYEELEEHVARPTANLIFRCELCLVTFATVNICQTVLHAPDFHINEAGQYPKNIPIELIAASPVDEELLLKEVCPECRKEVSSIIAHLWSNNPEDEAYQCPLCNAFTTRNLCRYNLHVKVHKNMAPFRCPDCAKLFKNSVELHIHLQDNCRHMEQSIRYKCSICGIVVRSGASLQNHTFSDHNPVKYKCHLCPAIFNIASEKNAHYDDQHLDELTPSALRRSKAYIVSHTCVICGEEDLKGFAFERHVRKHLSGHNSKFTIFICNCGFITMYKGTYLTHKSTPCITLDFSALNESLARLKMCISCSDLKFYNGKEPFICELCEIDDVTDRPHYKCTLCGAQIQYSMDYVIIHLHELHSLLNVEVPYSYVEKINFDCENNSILALSRPTLTNNFSNKCKKCSASFDEKDQLRSHYVSDHRGDSGDFHCLECGEAYKTVNSLSIHIRSHGITDVKTYIKKYDVCDELRPKNYSVQNENGSIELLCHVCEEKFNNPSKHYQHMRSHGMAFLKRIKHK